MDTLWEESREELKDGGAAMMAYAMMRLVDMADEERAFYYNAY